MKQILILSNHFMTLYAFRRELIQRLAQDGHQIFLSLPDAPENQYFEDLGCKIIPTQVDRRGVNPLKDLMLLQRYRQMMRRIQPDYIFSYTIKPNIYGSIASHALGLKQICNITGTGATFLRKTLLCRVVHFLYRRSVRTAELVFFQNTGDRDYFIQHNLINGNDAMLPGSGVNLHQFQVAPMPDQSIIRFIYIGRVMKLKGIEEYLACAKTIRSRHPNTEFLIAGWNEEAAYQPLVEQYHKAGVVRYLGFCDEIQEWIAQTHCTVLPSHGGEGVPNVLLESAAMGRACIASSIHGSTDVVEDGINGFLFEPAQASSLIAAVEQFLQLTPAQRQAMGLAGRAKVEREFDRELVIQAYLNMIEEHG